MQHFGSFRDVTHIVRPPTGKVRIWCTSHTPHGLGLSVLQQGKLEFQYEHTSVGHIVPGPDGSNVFTEYAGLYSRNLKLRSPKGRGLLLATLCPNNSHQIVSVVPDPGGRKSHRPKQFRMLPRPCMSWILRHHWLRFPIWNWGRTPTNATGRCPTLLSISESTISFRPTYCCPFRSQTTGLFCSDSN